MLSHGAGGSLGSGAGDDVAPCSAPVGSVTPLAGQHSRVRVGTGKKKDPFMTPSDSQLKKDV